MDLLEEKWRTLFRMFDLTHDKKIARDDLDINKNIFINFYGLQGAEAEAVRAQLDKYWDGIAFHGLEAKAEISEDEFVANLKKSYEADKAGTIKLIHECNDNWLKVADRNDDGFISMDELFAVYKAWNLGNENLVKIMFEMMGPDKDNLVPLGVVSDFFTEFFVGDNKDKYADFKKGFAAAGIALDKI